MHGGTTNPGRGRCHLTQPRDAMRGHSTPTLTTPLPGTEGNSGTQAYSQRCNLVHLLPRYPSYPAWRAAGEPGKAQVSRAQGTDSQGCILGRQEDRITGGSRLQAPGHMLYCTIRLRLRNTKSKIQLLTILRWGILSINPKHGALLSACAHWARAHKASPSIS